jgi:hypothetical protein
MESRKAFLLDSISDHQATKGHKRTHTQRDMYIYTYMYVYIYIYCIENAPTLVVFHFLSVATGLTLVAIGSRRAAIGWSCYNWFVSSCNGSNLL